MNSLSDNSERDLIYQETVKKVARLEDPIALIETASAGLHLLLQSPEDRHLLDRLSVSLGAIIGALPFEGPNDELRALTKQAVQRCLKVLQTAWDRPTSDTVKPAPHPGHASLYQMDEAVFKTDQSEAFDAEFDDQMWNTSTREDVDQEIPDLEYYLPPHLAHLLDHITYEIPQLVPVDAKYDNFDEWCCEVIIYRVNCVLNFFQRHNPNLVRELPPPFLLSPKFAERFATAIRQLIFPTLRNSRQLRLLSSTINYKGIDAETFWKTIDDISRASLQLVWSTAWDALKPVEVLKEGEVVSQIKEATKDLRKLLHPLAPNDYDLPRIGSSEIELFKSLFDTNFDWSEQLNSVWSHIHFLYEQEMDPRVFQQKAREGALRDFMLATLPKFPELWGEFIVLLCHRVFPRLSTVYLERFVRNFGTDKERRQRAMPHLMRYLSYAEADPKIKRSELLNEARWHEQVKELRKYLKGHKDADPPK